MVSWRMGVMVGVASCSLTSVACGEVAEEREAVETDEHALSVDVPVAGECWDLGDGPRNALTRVTPVTFRVQVFKTLVRVWLPEVSPGDEFEPLGSSFPGRLEYKQDLNPPHVIRSVRHAYWRLPHATAADPVIELRIDGDGSVPVAFPGAKKFETHLVLRHDPSSGAESLWISMTVKELYDTWGYSTYARLPSVSCTAQIGTLPSPL